MEESVSGFRRRGSWPDIVEHGERISRALRECGNEDEAFEEWEEWRPKPHERIETDVSAKTADQASVAEGEGEQAGRSPDEDLRTAGKRLSQSYEELSEDDAAGAMQKWQDSVDYVSRAADSASRKVIRSVENTVYQRVMTQIAPYYFDNELVSANVTRETSGDGSERFVFEININDDDLKAEVSEKLGEYEQQIDRWHVDTDKDVTAAEAAEGVEVTHEELDATSAKPPDERLPDPQTPDEDDEADRDA